MDISIIIPVYNEEKNLDILYKRLNSVLNSMKRGYEMIFVNDGSQDDSHCILKRFHDIDQNVKVINLDKNEGKTSALWIGICNAKGDYILILDSDLQYNPNDIVRILKELESFDVVKCHRINKKSSMGFLKYVASNTAIYIRNKILRENFRDAGSFIGFKRECLKHLALFKDMEVFMPSIFKIYGYKIKEIDIFVYPRRYGKSKYNIKNRLFKMLLRVFIVKFMSINKLNCRIMSPDDKK